MNQNSPGIQQHHTHEVQTVHLGLPPHPQRRDDPAPVGGQYDSQRALDSRPVIDMARGVLAATYHCSADQAFDFLVRASQHANVKLRLIAQVLVDTTQGKELSEPVRAHVRAAVDVVCGTDRQARSAVSTGG
ncbi:ANTAR domain-containing protein [Streptomyces sp. SAS_267]|uniref:ANTAR domain-containing protein n=1 Tax=unclassified Streptomyces TaxID=2593676 RepID=UPI003701468A